MTFHILAAVLILMYFAAPATAEMIVFSWVNRDGALEFTDDMKKVPAAYKEEVQQVTVDGLKDYQKYTPKDQKEE